MQEEVGRRETHMRRIEMRAFARDDGLWDVEAHLRDEKPYAYIDADRGPGSPATPSEPKICAPRRMLPSRMGAKPKA